MTSSASRYLELIRGRSRGPAAVMARGALRLASGPYGLVVRARNALFDRGWRVSRAAVPVVSVGNLTLGGTGKTPTVEYVARYFRERDVRVAILSRGYGSDTGPNDEALLLEENLPDVPHLQGADRTTLAATAVEELESQLLVLDDGFQHRKLTRDLDIVLVDATDPWGPGYLVPRGLLREPKRSLWRAGAVLLTRCEQAGVGASAQLCAEIRRYVRPGTPIVEAEHRAVEWLRQDAGPIPAESASGRRAAAFCGIGRPEAFRQTLQSLGVSLQDLREFPDHHAYARGDVDDLRRWAAGLPADSLILTTQKDAVKLRLAELAGRELWALRIGLAPRTGPEADALAALLDRLTPSTDVP